MKETLRSALKECEFLFLCELAFQKSHMTEFSFDLLFWNKTVQYLMLYYKTCEKQN